MPPRRANHNNNNNNNDGNNNGNEMQQMMAAQTQLMQMVTQLVATMNTQNQNNQNQQNQQSSEQKDGNQYRNNDRRNLYFGMLFLSDFILAHEGLRTDKCSSQLCLIVSILAHKEPQFHTFLANYTKD